MHICMCVYSVSNTPLFFDRRTKQEHRAARERGLAPIGDLYIFTYVYIYICIHVCVCVLCFKHALSFDRRVKQERRAARERGLAPIGDLYICTYVYIYICIHVCVCVLCFKHALSFDRRAKQERRAACERGLAPIGHPRWRRSITRVSARPNLLDLRADVSPKINMVLLITFPSLCLAFIFSLSLIC